MVLHPSSYRRFLIPLLIGTAVITLGLGCAFAILSASSRAGDRRQASQAVVAAEKTEDAPLPESTRDFRRLLSKTALAESSESEIRMLSEDFVVAAMREGKDPGKILAGLLPSPSEILAMIARDRDVDDFIENSNEENAAGKYYQNVVSIVDEFQPLLPKYEALFAGAYSALALREHDVGSYDGGVTLPGLSSRPNERQYDFSHTFALDIFLRDVETNPRTGLEKGPSIHSLTDGLVVAADSSWRGGETLETYRSGGITPKAGNGVIIYSPHSRKFFLYFHLHDTDVEKGWAVPRGYPLGRGGNTGTNARRPGHGEHLHLEIYDAASRKFLRNKDIARFVFD